jgi:hypothetical protein
MIRGHAGRRSLLGVCVFVPAWLIVDPGPAGQRHCKSICKSFPTISSRLPLLTHTSLDRPFPGLEWFLRDVQEAASMRREMLPWKSSGRMDVTVVVEARNGRILV